MTDFPDRLRASLADRYRIERELGGGGMSRVFVATELALGREVVIKVVSPDAMDSGAAERFAREVQLAARLQHTNIVPVLAAGEADGTAYYTMPYVRGESLRARMARGPVPVDEARALLRDVLRALAHAHAAGIVHRDVKPENVLLSGDGALVADFGIAKAIGLAFGDTIDTGPEATAGGARTALTRVGTSLGTPAYMAPEQVAGDVVDARTDLYAWGLMAWELLAGRHPFADRTTTQALLAAHLAERPAPLLDVLPPEGRRAPGVRELATLVMACIEKAPEARPADARTALTALDATVSGASVHLAPVPQSRRLLVLAGAALAVAAVTAALLRGRDATPTASGAAEGGTQAAPLAPKRVVVATFTNRSGDASLDPVGAMAADWIARGLATTGVVDVGGTAADLASRGVTTDAANGGSPLLALARAANAGLVISGAYYRQGDSVLFQADFTDANAGKLLQSVGPVPALAGAPLQGIEALRKRVVDGLAILLDSTLSSYAAQTVQLPLAEAYREFLQGEALFYRDERTAAAHYRRAAALDPQYAWPSLRLLGLATNRSNEALADSLLDRLRTRRASLTRFEAAYLDVLGCDREWSPAYDRCIEAGQALAQVAPRSQFAQYLAGLMYRWSNRPRSADSVLRRLDPASGELRGRVYFFTHRSAALLDLGDAAGALALADEARRLVGERAVLLQYRVSALVALRRGDEAERVLDDAWTLPSDLGVTVAAIAARTIRFLRLAGDSARAERLGVRVLVRLDARPATESQGPAGRDDRMRVLVALRRWPAVVAITDSMAREGIVALPMSVARGVALALLGRRAEAIAIEARLAADRRPIGSVDQCSTGFRTCRAAARATLRAALGDRAGAMVLIEGENPRWYFDAEATGGVMLDELLRGYPAWERWKASRG